MFPSTDTAFKAFLSARFCSAIWSHISDCDETYNYWEPVSCRETYLVSVSIRLILFSFAESFPIVWKRFPNMGVQPNIRT